MVQFLRGEQTHRVLSVRHIAQSAFVLRLSREELVFNAGQHITLSIPGIGELREYSLYTSPADDYLEVLVTLVEDGQLTPHLSRLRPGDRVTIDGPNGYFALRPSSMHLHHLLIATGTGISPFHSFARTYPELQYTLIHGIREVSESYDKGDFRPGSYLACTSRSTDGHFHGRVTDFLRSYDIPYDSEIMLCGNSQMILDVWELLPEKGVDPGKMRQEIYF